MCLCVCVCVCVSRKPDTHTKNVFFWVCVSARQQSKTKQNSNQGKHNEKKFVRFFFARDRETGNPDFIWSFRLNLEEFHPSNRCLGAVSILHNGRVPRVWTLSANFKVKIHIIIFTQHIIFIKLHFPLPVTAKLDTLNIDLIITWFMIDYFSHFKVRTRLCGVPHLRTLLSVTTNRFPGSAQLFVCCWFFFSPPFALPRRVSRRHHTYTHTPLAHTTSLVVVGGVSSVGCLFFVWSVKKKVSRKTRRCCNVHAAQISAVMCVCVNISSR